MRFGVVSDKVDLAVVRRDSVVFVEVLLEEVQFYPLVLFLFFRKKKRSCFVFERFCKEAKQTKQAFSGIKVGLKVGSEGCGSFNKPGQTVAAVSVFAVFKAKNKGFLKLL